MCYQLIQSILILTLLLSTSGEMNGQSNYTIIIEDQFIVEPNKFSLKINCLSSKIPAKQWIEKESYISKDSVISLLQQIGNVKIMIAPSDQTTEPISEYLDVISVEVSGINTYQVLMDQLRYKAMILVDEYHVEDFEKHEALLIDRIINQAQNMVSDTLETSGRTIEKLISYEEVNESIERKNPISTSGDFGILKESFVEANYKGHMVNSQGQIVLKKKLKVTYLVK